MKQSLFTVKDTKAEYYMNPFCAKSRGDAIRSFGDIANDKNSQIGMHPEDFILFYIGEFDPTTGTTTLVDHESLGKALDYVQQPSTPKLEAVK